MLLLHRYQTQSLGLSHRLLNKLQGIDADIVSVEVAALYFLIPKDDSSQKLRQILANSDEFIKSKEGKQACKLLDIDNSKGGAGWPWRDDVDKLLYVVAREGMISSWSSKATDIFQICKMDSIARVEKGFCYRLQPDARSNKEDTAFSTAIKEQLHDRMTELVYSSREEVEAWSAMMQAHESSVIKKEAERAVNPLKSTKRKEAQASPQSISDYIQDYGKDLGLSADELSHLARYYEEINRMPTDTELMMYAQVNSEHCRHKLFNAYWSLDSKPQKHTLFGMIQSTLDDELHNVLSAYEDNASVAKSTPAANCLQVSKADRCYYYRDYEEGLPFLMKVETHNHPTAISPFPGAATGSGGEIRDESATGRGGHPRMGLVGFSVSNLHIPDFEQPWECPPKYPERIASALQIMTEGPLGAARFNNEFGRPCVCGYFRTYEQHDGDSHWGYHKPIMIAGGLGSIRPNHSAKEKLKPNTSLVVFGGSAMRIGLGGGSASSLSSGSSSHDLDFASVQRDNAEMQRRCQEVIEQCTEMGGKNPILSIHDVGAGGLANALPELVHDSMRGAHINLRAIPCADNTLTPMEIWCNESQERYVAAIKRKKLGNFLEICARERCPWAIIGKVTKEEVLILEDTSHPEGTSGRMPVNMPMSVLFKRASYDDHPLKTVKHPNLGACKWQDIDLNDAVKRVLKMPAVASKSFLITIGDRSVTGLIARDQMVGPWQVPVADVAVSSNAHKFSVGEAMAMGERTPVAALNAPASGRLAVAEAILNILAADIWRFEEIYLSANWMAAASIDEQRFDLYQTVQAVTELCKALRIVIPVGKDSLSMQMKWQDASRNYEVNSPLSLIVSAFAPAVDVIETLTPQLNTETTQKRIFLIDVSGGDNRLGGSSLMQAYQRKGEPPDLDNPQRLLDFFKLKRTFHYTEILAYHDRSDGGLLIALMEMAFAANCGVCCELDDNDELLPILFSEAPGVLLQLSEEGVEEMRAFFTEHENTLSFKEVARIQEDKKFEVKHKGQSWLWDLMQLKRWWSETSSRLQALRDDRQCADEEMESLCDADNPGLHAEWDFDVPEFPNELTAKYEVDRFCIKNEKPKVAILREQGVNGHMEMAAAFERAGFAAYDVHMSELIKGEVELKHFQGIAACGGFSYGDVLGAGAGWAHSILLHDRTREDFEIFFNRSDTFALGVCNGCQMLSRIKEIIPGAAHWPMFEGNRSNQFESRLVMVEITPSPSVLLKEMDGARLPIVVAHGEGKAMFRDRHAARQAVPYTCLRYIDNYDKTTEHYPENPNGSINGMTAFCSTDGRATIMMPHPERLFRTDQYSWCPSEWEVWDAAPWFKLFHNAYRFCQEA